FRLFDDGKLKVVVAGGRRRAPIQRPGLQSNPCRAVRAKLVSQRPPRVFTHIFVVCPAQRFPVSDAKIYFAVGENFFVSSYRYFIRVNADPKLFTLVGVLESGFKAQRQEHDRRRIIPLFDQGLRSQLAKELTNQSAYDLLVAAEILALIRDALASLVEFACAIFKSVAALGKVIYFTLEAFGFSFQPITFMFQFRLLSRRVIYLLRQLIDLVFQFRNSLV